jgi:hypothetical protein
LTIRYADAVLTKRTIKKEFRLWALNDLSMRTRNARAELSRRTVIIVLTGGDSSD